MTSTKDKATQERVRTASNRANWRTPDATKVDVDENADRDAWLRERRDGIGGTDAAAIMGVHVTTTLTSVPDVTAAHVFADKVSPDDPVEEDKAIYHLGHVMEDQLLAVAAERFDIRTRPAGFYRHNERWWQYANPDALTSDGGLAECKTVGRRTQAADKWAAGDVSDHAYIQGQHYLAVTGRSHIYYTVGIRDDYSGWDKIPRHLWTEPWFAAMAIKDWFQVGPIERDEAVIAALIEAEAELWDAVQVGEMPDHIAATLHYAERFPSGAKDQDVAAAIPERVTDDLAKLREVKRRQDDLAAERKAIEDRVKAEIGGGEYLTVDGTRVARWRTQTTSKFDKAGLAAEAADLVARHTHKKTQRVFTLLDTEGANA